VGDVDGQACPRARNWRGRDHGSIIVRTVGLPPILQNRSCLGAVADPRGAEGIKIPQLMRQAQDKMSHCR